MTKRLEEWSLRLNLCLITWAASYLAFSTLIFPAVRAVASQSGVAFTPWFSAAYAQTLFVERHPVLIAGVLLVWYGVSVRWGGLNTLVNIALSTYLVFVLLGLGLPLRGLLS